MPLEGVCKISKASAASNWSYDPETDHKSKNTLLTPVTLTFDLWPRNWAEDITLIKVKNSWKKDDDPVIGTYSKRCDGRTDGQTDRRTDGRTDGQADRQIDSQTYRRTDGQTDRQRPTFIYIDLMKKSFQNILWNGPFKTSFKHL